MKPIQILFIVALLKSSMLLAHPTLWLSGQMHFEAQSNDAPVTSFLVIETDKKVSIGAGDGWEASSGQRKVQLAVADDTISKCFSLRGKSPAEKKRILEGYTKKKVQVFGELRGRTSIHDFLPIVMMVKEIRILNCDKKNVSLGIEQKGK